MLNSPISIQKIDRVIELLELGPESRVVDLGCGEGDFLHRIIDRFGAECHGIDPDRNALAICRQRGHSMKLNLHPTTGTEFDWPEEAFDLAVCIGSSHAFGGYIPTLRKLRDHVRPDGFILMGDIYWRHRPIREYEEFLGEGWPSFDSDHASHVAAGEAEGLLSLYSVRSSEDEWDHFEGSFVTWKIRKTLTIADEDTRNQQLAENKRWRDAYLKWGYSTIGFGLYLFQNTKS